MRITTATPSPSDLPGGSPFDTPSDRLLWEAGYPCEFDTLEEAEEAARAVLALHPGLTFEVHP